MGYDTPRLPKMILDPEACSRARLARDARFDGKFFIGVVTTKIYCRPICRTRLSMEKNVRYFPTAAAAAEAGFRPCLRCRPECSPGTAVWAGTRNTVARALSLMTERGLQDQSVEDLAGRLGVGSHHLRRLFLRHVGATPGAVAQAVRLQFAKKLIDETRLPMTQVALSSGFGSVRRFNAAIRAVYGRTPTQVRALARRIPAEAENEYLFQLTFRRPYNWKRVVEFLAARAVPGVEAVDGGRYRRSISLQGVDGYVEVGPNDFDDGLSLRVHCPDPRLLFVIVERIRAMFDLNADWEVIAGALRVDPDLAGRIDAETGLRVPGCWSGLELAVHAILEQQGERQGKREVRANSASALAGKLASTLGRSVSFAGGITRVFPTAEVLADADLMGLGVPESKAETIRILARAVRDGHIKFDGIMDCDGLVAQLCKIPGLTKWAATIVTMRALRDPDAFPSEDSVLRNEFDGCSAADLERRSEAWRPWRAYAAMLLWQNVERRSDDNLELRPELRPVARRRPRTRPKNPTDASAQTGPVKGTGVWGETQSESVDRS